MMPHALERLADALAQAACDRDQDASGHPHVILANHAFARRHYRAEVDCFLPAINAWAGDLLAGGDPDFAWVSRPGCGQRNAEGAGPLLCVRAAGHRDAHAFEASAGLNLKESEAVQ